MKDTLTLLIFLAGFAQWSVLLASALVPFRLDWRHQLKSLPRLHRQLFWVYGLYIVLAIVGFGLLSVLDAAELSEGRTLARAVCAYIAAFWGIRLALQAIFDVKPHLTTWWLRAGYHSLSLLFVSFTLLYGYAALRQPG
jgi:hypothetical protein